MLRCAETFDNNWLKGASYGSLHSKAPEDKRKMEDPDALLKIKSPYV